MQKSVIKMKAASKFYDLFVLHRLCILFMPYWKLSYLLQNWSKTLSAAVRIIQERTDAQVKYNNFEHNVITFGDSTF